MSSDQSSESRDVVIVGGGVAGSVLGGSLASAGHSVLILEQSEAFEDRVRGEWIAPWGVVETKRLGIYEKVRALGGHLITQHVGYDELLPPEVAEAAAIDLGVWSDAPGPLTIEHVTLQNGLLALAQESGAVVRRGVRGVVATPGRQPVVSFRDGERDQTVTCRLLVGADGRSSGVRRQLGIALHEDPVDHLIAGMLVEGIHDWPETRQSIGKVGDIQYLIFPQGNGRARLYADYDATGRGRFSGPKGSEAFLSCFRMDPVPGSEEFADATPIGPCRSYPSQDAWTDRPVAPGVVLVGDAAGYNDPIIGQGLSIALRDVRIVRDLLAENSDWGPTTFEPYIVERRERLRRLRQTAQYATRLGARFDATAISERTRAITRIGADPELFPLIAAFAGPEAMPKAQLAEDFADRLFGLEG